MSNTLAIPDLDLVCKIGKTTAVAQPNFQNGLICGANSTTIPGLIADNTDISASTAGTLSIRLLNTEFLNYKYIAASNFAGAICTFPLGTSGGVSNATLASGLVITSTLATSLLGASITIDSPGVLVLRGSSTTGTLGISTNGTTAATKTIILATQTANRTISLPDATDTVVGKATTDTITNKDLQSTTNTFPTKCRRGEYELWATSLRNAATARYPGQGATSAYSPPENIHLTKLTIGGNVTIGLAAATLTVTAWKGAETASTNEAFQIVQSIASTGEFKTTDTTVNNSGKDAITTSDNVHISAVPSAGTSTITDFYAILEYTYDSA